MDIEEEDLDLNVPIAPRVFTVGHSNHTLDYLLGLLKQHDVEILVDVRSAPYSRYTRQFNRDNLAGFLDDNSLRYEYLGGQLGGRPDDPECYDGADHVVYDYLERTESFRDGIAAIQWQLRERRSICLMCSEEDPAVCHRALSVGHVLTRLGIEVLHIRKDGSLQEQGKLQGKSINMPQQTSLFEEEPLRKSLQPVSRERAPNSFLRS